MIWEDAIKMLQEMQLRSRELDQKKMDGTMTPEECDEWIGPLDRVEHITPEWVADVYDTWKKTMGGKP